MKTSSFGLAIGALVLAAVAQVHGQSGSQSARAVIETGDVKRFYEIYDAAAGHPGAEELQRYIDSGSVGLQTLARRRNVTGQAIADAIARKPETYAKVRECIEVLPRVRARLSVAMQRLESIYPDARFPSVTIAIGKGKPIGVGGRASGVQIGAEALCANDWINPNTEDRFVRVVMHEFVHVQGRAAASDAGITVLSASLKEGAAEFVTELTTGAPAYAYMAKLVAGREKQIEAAFLADAEKLDLSDWLYNSTPEKPGDLGYWVGYRIVKSYYQRAVDKQQALRDILDMTDAKAFLAKSGWHASGDAAVEPLDEGLRLQSDFPPRIGRTDDGALLRYELRVTNGGHEQIRIRELRVSDAKGDVELLKLTGQKLRGAFALNRDGCDSERGLVPSGGECVMFVDTDLTRELPQSVQNRIAFETTEGTRHADLDLSVADDGPRLSPPLRGGPWVAVANGGWPRGHRRVFLATDGKPRIPGRFAIDWMKVDPLGRTLRDDSGLVASSYSLGAEVLAVADGPVLAARDGIAEAIRISDNQSQPHPDAAGNFISLALPDGSFATYEHLRRGSLNVTEGDRVRAGQVIARIGFSGDSTQPHLHFHVSDSPLPLAGEGMPYTLDHFRLLTHIDDWTDFGRRALPVSTPRVVDASLPRGGDVMTFDP